MIIRSHVNGSLSPQHRFFGLGQSLARTSIPAAAPVVNPITDPSLLWVEPARPVTCPFGRRATVVLRLDLANVGETRTFAFDFSFASEIQAGDTLNSATITPAAPGNVSFGTASIVGKKVLVPVTATALASGDLCCRCQTANGRTLEIAVYVVVTGGTSLQGGVVAFREDLGTIPTTESRLVAFDYRNFPEIIAGNVLMGTPVVTVYAGSNTPLTLTVLGIAVGGQQVVCSLTGGGPAWSSYVLTGRCNSSDGSVLVAAGTFILAGG